MTREEVKFAVKNAPISVEDAKLVMRAFLVPEDLGTPAGGISLRGATNFRTPPGWDPVYTPIFNMIERPVAPALVVRVETDWYAHESEFRYVLQPGEGFPGAHTMPIGQVFFVPREEITLADCTAEELETIRISKLEFAQQKAAHKITTPYGLQYSPHYLRQSKDQKTGRSSAPDLITLFGDGQKLDLRARRKTSSITVTTMNAMAGARIATIEATNEPASSTEATMKLPAPAVKVVLLRRRTDITVWTIPAVPPPATIATDHRTNGGRSVITAAVATIPASTASGPASASRKLSTSGT